MLKKLVIACFAVVVGLFVLNKTKFGDYAKLWVKDHLAAAEKQVPLETKIERLEVKLAQAKAEVREHFDAIAEEEVSIANLEAELKTMQAKHEKQEGKIRKFRQDLKGDTQFITYGDTAHPRHKVERQLKRNWEAFQHAEKELKAKENLLDKKKDALNAANEKLQAMKDACEELAQQLETLKADLRTLRAAQARSKFAIDNSALAPVKEGVQQVANEIKVANKKLEHENDLASGPIDPDQKSTKDVMKDIDAHFGGKAKEKVAANGK